MPDLLQIEDSPELAERRAEIRQRTHAVATEILHRFCAPFPTQKPFEWCVEHLILNDPEVKGPFDPVGRYYLADIINDNNEDDVREQTLITGTGVGKTLTNIGGMAWKMKHRPCRNLTVMPATKGEGGSEAFATTRFIPTIEATRALAELIPAGQRRLYLNSKRVRLNGAHFGFVGANSSSQIASNRCGDIRMDEADKYKGKLGDEAGTDSLVKERIEGVLDYQVFRNTTPTVETRLGWKNLLRSDFRRRFLPCPHCNGEVRGSRLEARTAELPSTNSHLLTTLKGWMDLAWSEQYCVIPTKFLAGGAFETGTPIPRAYIAWDKEALRQDGTHDLARVFRSTRFHCPHCGGHIRDEHKTWMDKNGVWLPLQGGTPHHRGYHLPSLYAPSLPGNENSQLGGRALKFLNAHEDGEGMKGFINSTLAEVDVMQEHGRNQIELNSTPLSQTDWVPLLTADFHKNWPYIWFVVRKWCAFKLLPLFPITNGLPDFVPLLLEPGNEGPLEKCAGLLGLKSEISHLRSPNSELLKPHPSWLVIAELMRFDSRTGSSPLIEFLIAQNITGEKLVKLYREDAHGHTMDFRKLIHRLMHPGSAGVPPVPPRGGDSELIAAGYCELSGYSVWEEMRDIAKEYRVGHGMSIPNRCVMIDCGFAEKFQRTVLQMCFESAEQFKYYDPANSPKNAPLFFENQRHQYCLPAPRDGWLPIRGKPTNRPLGGGKLRPELNLDIGDPYYGTPKAGTTVIEILEIPQGLFWLRKEDLRQKRTKNQYTVSPQVQWFPRIHNVDGTLKMENGRAAANFKQADYEKHINEQYYDEAKGSVQPRHGKGGAQSRNHPYHLDDCETYQIAAATHLEFFEQSETK